VYNRGVEKRPIFLDDRDRWRFIQGVFLFNDERASANLLWQIEREHRGKINFHILQKFIEKNKTNRKLLVRILADCLMPNHYHFILKEIKDGGITQFMHKLGTGYAMYFNKKYERVGSLFQGRFKALCIDNDDYLKNLLVYINVLNPAAFIEPDFKEKGIQDIESVLRFAKSFLWSTHQEYLGLRSSPVIDWDVLKTIFPEPYMYEDFVRTVLVTKEIDSFIPVLGPA
jgi:putative transposase